MSFPTWDQETEKYEDFLERLPESAQRALAEGGAFLASPSDGYDLLKLFMESLEEQAAGTSEIDRWKEMTDAIATEDECKQKISDVLALEAVATEMAKDIAARKREIHTETCEECQALGDKKPSASHLKRALDAAREAFREAVKIDPEPWKEEESE